MELTNRFDRMHYWKAACRRRRQSPTTKQIWTNSTFWPLPIHCSTWILFFGVKG